MGKPKGLKDRLFGAAVLKMSFRLRGDEALRGTRLLSEMRDEAVEKYIQEHRGAVEAAARGKPPA